MSNVVAQPKPTIAATPVSNGKRPASISITKPQASTASGGPVSNSTSVQASQPAMNEDFNNIALENAWRNFASTINDDVKRVNFQTINLPVRISKNEIEVSVNNFMQENELKKIQTDIVQFIGIELRNTSIKLLIKVVEESDMQKKLSPEERYKQMAEENPLLEKLRKNLQMEID